MSLKLKLLSAAIIGTLALGAAPGAFAAVHPHTASIALPNTPDIAADYQYQGQHYAYRYHGKYYHHRRHVNGHWVYN